MEKLHNLSSQAKGDKEEDGTSGELTTSVEDGLQKMAHQKNEALLKKNHGPKITVCERSSTARKRA